MPNPRKAIPAVILALIAGVIAVEGGYVNHPSDPGGETNMGITKKVAVKNGYTGPMRQLPRSVAESIYYQSYLVKPGYAPLISLDAAVTEELFDTTVNMGPDRPSRWFQRSINLLCGTNLDADGQVGPQTVSAFQSCQGSIGASELCIGMLDSLDAAQRVEYARLIRRNPKLNDFRRGWLNKRIGNVSRAKCMKADA